MTKGIIAKTLLASFGFLTLFTPSQASAQLIPQPWVSVGSNEGDITYAVGARALNLGVEVGSGPDGSTGVDVLKFINLPVISPYVGLGLYSEDKGLAVSGGIQVGATKNVFVGGGYNSVRGVNGQIGIRF
ncbi:hypothetical protein [Nostoc sp. FACHB-110]|uniref:hypothetical protein n=1 Tax=Nostoc sp. FACHB-110 TaxID=2692834 RepID=UPI0016887A0F|nr:hypothetical protein [Nostoc sp. FACHB-110]MBD2439063.1 hypothetical protein [Nostoc sp. FACHB-110]